MEQEMEKERIERIEREREREREENGERERGREGKREREKEGQRMRTINELSGLWLRAGTLRHKEAHWEHAFECNHQEGSL
jgi:hypothetical protein